MILDAFKLNAFTIQITYPDAFELWDQAGSIARQLTRIWPDLSLEEGLANEQILRSSSVAITTGLRVSTIALSDGKGFDQATVDKAANTLALWRAELSIEKFTRISCRAKYVKEFPTKKAANAEVLSWNLCRWPVGKVFEQPEDAEANGIDLLFRLEDANSFTHVRVGAEEVKIELMPHPEFPDIEVHKQKSRVYVDVDRGLLGSVRGDDFRISEWLKGYHHVLRRDIDKLLPVEVRR